MRRKIYTAVHKQNKYRRQKQLWCVNMYLESQIIFVYQTTSSVFGSNALLFFSRLQTLWSYLKILDIPMKFSSSLVLVGCCTAFLYKALRLLFVVLMYKCNVSFTKQGNNQWLTSLYWTSTQHLLRLGAIQDMCDGSHTLAMIISWVEKFVDLLF